jgi:RNA polymerase sigma-70 factor (ECF subfamily)
MDTAAFERLYATHFGALQRYCNFKLPSKPDADDVLQDVALAAWTHHESVWSDEAFKPWLLKIAANKTRDFYRKRARQLCLPLDGGTEITFQSSRLGVTVEETVAETLREPLWRN